VNRIIQLSSVTYQVFIKNTNCNATSTGCICVTTTEKLRAKCKICHISVLAVTVKRLGSKNITQDSITEELQSLIAVCESIWRVRCMCQRLQQVASVSELITNTTFKHFIAIQQPVQLSFWVADIPQQWRPGCLQCSISNLKVLHTVTHVHCLLTLLVLHSNKENWPRQDTLPDYETYSRLG
jgi:hypothetical protein